MLAKADEASRTGLRRHMEQLQLDGLVALYPASETEKALETITRQGQERASEETTKQSTEKLEKFFLEGPQNSQNGGEKRN